MRFPAFCVQKYVVKESIADKIAYQKFARIPAQQKARNVDEKKVRVVRV